MRLAFNTVNGRTIANTQMNCISWSSILSYGPENWACFFIWCFYRLSGFI